MMQTRLPEAWEASPEAGVTTSIVDGTDVVSIEHGGLQDIIATTLPLAGP